jgi:hypothetical protein
MSASIDTIRTEASTVDATETTTGGRDDTHRKTLDVSDVDPDRVTAYARATAEEGHLELYFERKGGRTFLVAP